MVQPGFDSRQQVREKRHALLAGRDCQAAFSESHVYVTVMPRPEAALMPEDGSTNGFLGTLVRRLHALHLNECPGAAPQRIQLFCECLGFGCPAVLGGVERTGVMRLRQPHSQLRAHQAPPPKLPLQLQGGLGHSSQSSALRPQMHALRDGAPVSQQVGMADPAPLEAVVGALEQGGEFSAEEAIATAQKGDERSQTWPDVLDVRRACPFRNACIDVGAIDARWPRGGQRGLGDLVPDGTPDLGLCVSEGAVAVTKCSGMMGDDAVGFDHGPKGLSCAPAGLIGRKLWHTQRIGGRRRAGGVGVSVAMVLHILDTSQQGRGGLLQCDNQGGAHSLFKLGNSMVLIQMTCSDWSRWGAARRKRAATPPLNAYFLSWRN